MRIVYTPNAKEDINYWKRHDQRLLKRLRILIASIKTNPFQGIGNPEPLKHDLKGCWSRRINQEHRLVYKVSGNAYEQTVTIIQARFHY